MIMGDIVVECCDSCKNLENGCMEEEAAPTTDEVKVDDAANSKPSDNVPIIDVRDAARFIVSCASNGEGLNARKNCSQCVRFLRARFVKNANGTDMHLQKEALRVRREYIRKRREDMAVLLSGGSEHFAVGSGPYI
jgi:L-lysine 2,3-aminomutase